MIDHTGVSVEDFESSREFYAAALAPLGYDLLLEFHSAIAGFGEAGKPDFWIGGGEANTRGSTSPSVPILVGKSRRSTRRR